MKVCFAIFNNNLHREMILELNPINLSHKYFPDTFPDTFQLNLKLIVCGQLNVLRRAPERTAMSPIISEINLLNSESEKYLHIFANEKVS